MDKLYCSCCGKEKSISQYYKSNSPKFANDNYKYRVSFCKDCCKKIVYKNNKVDKDAFISLLRDKIDAPFFNDIYIQALNSDKETVGKYIALLNTYQPVKELLRKNKTISYSDGEIEEENKNESVNISNDNNIKKEEYALADEELEKLKDKYGYGYSDEEYYLFEKKYQQLRPSIQLLTTMHDEFFREYCVDKVKETLAKAKGDFKEAKEWASMAKDAAAGGKLQPSQMSKSDLTGGLDTFGQLSRMIEQTPKGEILEILPKFIEKPKDKVDVVLWLHINGIRDIKGLPPCEYKDIYKFYEEKRESYERQMLDNKENSEVEIEGDENGGL
jgi:hypothetical protein